jgi:protocatechuate 3,4-dioxygenase beta subunit
MLKSRFAVSCLLVLLPALAAATPLRVTGRIEGAPNEREISIELRALVSSHADALKLLAGGKVPAVASARPRPDGSFEILAPESGLYRVVVQATGRLPVEALLVPFVEDAELPPVALQPASPVDFLVLGTDGKPVAGLRLRALALRAFNTGPSGWRPAQSDGVTDAAGRVTLVKAANDELSLVALVPGVPDRFLGKFEGARHTLQLPRREPRILEVRGRDGKPAAGVLARWSFMPLGVTGADGRLPLPEATSGTSLRLETADGVQAVVPVAAEERGTLVVRLPGGEVQSGRVLDVQTRKPLPGALVWGEGYRPVRADAAGQFNLRAFSPGEEIQAAAAGHLPGSSSARFGQGPPLALLLDPATAIEGVVVDAQGAPVAGAHVKAGRRGWSEHPEVESGADGRFRLAGLLLGGLYQLTAAKEGFAPADLEVEPPALGKGAPLRVVLRQGAGVAGRVVDAQGTPLAGVELLLAPSREYFQDGEMREPLQASTDAAGHFRFGGLSAGLFVLRGARRGFAPATVRGIEIPTSQEPPRTVDLGDVLLAPGVSLEGRVTDPRGAPVAGAEVVHMQVEDMLAWRMAPREPILTGADGRFRIEDLAPGSRSELYVHRAGYQTAQLPGVEVPRQEPLRIELTPARILTGRVVGPAREPVPQATIRQMESSEIWMGGSSMGSAGMTGTTSSDDQGRFLLEQIGAASFDLTVAAAGYRPRRLTGIQVPEDGAPLEIALDKGESLDGQVVDGRGEPVAGVSVDAYLAKTDGVIEPDHAVTDADGRYRLEGLTLGSNQVQAQGRTGLRAHALVEVKPGPNRLDLVLASKAEVSGRVLDETGAPVAGATVHLWPLTNGGFFTASTTADGSFRLRDVEDGGYRLLASGPGYAEASLPDQVHVAGEPLGGFELKLQRGAVLTGKLRGFAPEELRRLQIMAMGSSGRSFPLEGTVTGAEYRVSGLSPWTWYVTARVQDGPSVSGMVTLEPGMERATLDLEAPTGFVLSGRALVDGAPLAGAQVHAVPSAPPKESYAPSMTSTDWEGKFRLTGLAPGSYRLFLSGPGGVGHTQTVEISGDQSVAIDIATGAARGQVLTAAGEPVADAIVALESEAEDLGIRSSAAGARSDPQGRFELPRLAAGTYKVTVQKEGFAPATSRIAVTPEGTVEVQVVLRLTPP